MYKNLLYYKYVNIDNPEEFKEEHKAFCKSLNLLGKILVAKEGINGCVSGTPEDTQTYMDAMLADPRFADMEFKIGNCAEHTFTKMIVRTRPEIVTFGTEVDLKNSAPYIEPQELKKLLDENPDVIMIDARNKYEADFGTFKGAIVPDIDVFKDFPKAMEELENLKDKPIVTFCTGGIRCEKASAYLREKGFTNVRQLHGGILTYAEECGSEHWDGECFVFDERVAVDMDDVSAVHENRVDTECCFVAPFKKPHRE